MSLKRENDFNAGNASPTSCAVEGDEATAYKDIISAPSFPPSPPPSSISELRQEKSRCSNPQMQTPSPVASRGAESQRNRKLLQVKNVMKRPSTIPDSDNLEEMMEALLSEIRTAGLRKGRENVLVDMVRELRQTSKEHTSQYKRVVKDWSVFAEDKLSIANETTRRMEQSCANFDREAASHRQETERMSLEHASVVQGLNAKISELTLRLEQSERGAAEERKQHEAAIVKIEDAAKVCQHREVSRVKTRLIREAEKKVSEPALFSCRPPPLPAFEFSSPRS